MFSKDLIDKPWWVWHVTLQLWRGSYWPLNIAGMRKKRS
jgi:hypothetical protein